MRSVHVMAWLGVLVRSVMALWFYTNSLLLEFSPVTSLQPKGESHYCSLRNLMNNIVQATDMDVSPVRIYPLHLPPKSS